MALNTANPYVNALANTPWPIGHHTGSNYVRLNVSFADNGSGKAWTADERAAFMSAAYEWTKVTNIVFLETPLNSHTDLVERKATSPDFGGTDYVYGRHEKPTGNVSDVLNGRFNTTKDPAASQAYFTAAGMSEGGIMYETFVHELGHAIGLNHPHDGPNSFPGMNPLYDADGDGNPDPASDPGSNGLNNVLYSIMSYNEPSGSDPTVNPNRGFAASPMAFDIATIQALYGATENATGNNTYLITDTFKGFHCIWDTRGTDTLKYEGNKDTTLDLRAATLLNEVGGGGRLSSVKNGKSGYLIAGDFTNFIADDAAAGEFGVIIENATGGGGKDKIYGNGVTNVLKGNGGDDKMYGFGGDDRLYGGSDEDTLDGGDGVDVLFGDDGDDHLVGGTGQDRLYGGADDDTLTGGTGAGADGADNETDYLYGQGGSDDYFVTDRFDVVVETTGGPFTNDTVHTLLNTFSLAPGGQVRGDVEALTFYGTGNFEGTGNKLDNTIIGGEGSDKFYGLGGVDTLIGNGGNDYYYLFDFSNNQFDTIVENARGGSDWVYVKQPTSAAKTYTMAANVENGVINDPRANGFTLIGNGLANTMYDDVGANTLDGAGGADTLNGGAGLDFLIGGADSDTYYLADRTGAFFDAVIEDANGGTRDYVIVSAIANEFGKSYELTANVEICEIVGTADFDVTGNNSSNRLFGNAAANTLSGGDGIDYLSGMGGLDTLIGGGGSDKYFLEDLVAGLNVYDTVIEDANGGAADIVYVQSFNSPGGASRLGYQLTDNVENGTITGSIAFDLSGNGLRNVLKGNSADNSIAGLGGGDTIDGGDGFDTASYAASSVGVTIDLRPTIGTGVGGDAQGDTLAGIERVLGSAFADTMYAGTNAVTFEGGDGENKLYGGSGADILIGGANNDILDGGALADQMIGGAGDDSYYVDVVSDRVIELAGPGGGVDTIFTALSRLDLRSSLFGVNVENLTYTGAGGLVGYGNGLDNYLLGGANADRLYGFGGNDILDGGEGGDRLDGGANDDTLYGGGGIDQLLGGTGDDTLDGGAAADNLDGGDGNDFEIGGDGADVFVFKGTAATIGNDTIYGGTLTSDDSAADAVNFVGVQGFLSVDLGTGGYAISDATDFAHGGLHGIERVYGTETADRIYGGDRAEILNGNGGDDEIYGAGGVDIIDGGFGNDTIDGGAGADRINGGEGNDFLTIDGLDTFDGGAGFDRVTLFNGTFETPVSVKLVGTNVEYVTSYSGADTIDGTGVTTAFTVQAGAGNDKITGGSANDVIFGEGDDDVIDGGLGADSLNGGDGNDTIIGGGGATSASTEFDGLYGDGGNDTLIANGYYSQMYGGEGNDHLIGEDDFQSMNGGIGDDELTGGAGGDGFNFEDNWGLDTITDFNFQDGDRLNFFRVTGLDNFSQFSISDGTNGADMAFGGFNIHLTGVIASQVNSNWVVFY